jgi:hypothetical protein
MTQMPTGPKGQKRPADVISNAVKVMRIATGEEEEVTGDAIEPERLAAQLKKGGEKGGKARAYSLTKEQRTEIATLAAQARWKKS